MYSVWVKEIFYPTVLNAAITSIEGTGVYIKKSLSRNTTYNDKHLPVCIIFDN